MGREGGISAIALLLSFFFLIATAVTTSSDSTTAAVPTAATGTGAVAMRTGGDRRGRHCSPPARGRGRGAQA